MPRRVQRSCRKLSPLAAGEPLESARRAQGLLAAPGRRTARGETRHRRHHDDEPVHTSTGTTAPLIRAVQSASLRTLIDSGVALAIGSDNVGDSSVLEAEHLRSLGVVDELALLKLWDEDTPRSIFPQRRIGFLVTAMKPAFWRSKEIPWRTGATSGAIKLRFTQGLEVH